MASEADPNALNLITEIFDTFGLNAAEHLLSEEEGRTVYGFQRGSAQLFLILSYDDQGSWVQVISPILSLPPDDTRVECYEYLLRLNTSQLVNCSFGIEDEQIVIGSDRSTMDLQGSELKDMVLCVSAFADEFDDVLAKKFGCQLLGDSVL